MEDTTTSPETFDTLTIEPAILQVLHKHEFTVPTPIQKAAIPLGLTGKDMIGIAQTGTGKTLAFGIPMMQRIKAGGGHGLVLVPTRELALQVEETLRRFTPALGMRTAVLIGGASMHLQRQMIRNRPNIVVATPGRLLDHMEQGNITLKTVKVLVLDEADRMLDMGFAPQINKILDNVPRERQTLLFSATMPSNIVQLATKHMNLPVRVEVAPAGTPAARVTQEVMIVRKENKAEVLVTLLKETNDTVLVFSRTKHGAKKLTRTVQMAGFKAAEIHANRSLAQRKEALHGFKTGRYRVLIATDIAARGIDVTGIGLVVNFDLPDNPEDYIHRIGRTGRAGLEGRAISFATPDQHGDVRGIEKLMKGVLPISSHPSHPKEQFDGRSQSPATHHYRSRRPQRGGGGGGFRRGGGGRHRR